MGTAQEWFLVFIVGFLFGGFMAWLNPRPKFVQPPRIYRTLYLLNYALFGLWFGVMEVFRGSRSFRPPLVYLNVGIFVCGLLLSFPLRRFNRTLPRQAKKPGLFPAPDFSRIEKKSDANDVA
jgi:hypothetical protein